ncbi:ATP-dependent RNA helicase HrpA [Arthrobacter sp. Hiyo4]|nr:ATP-dependent RNA helicase HrpA [Arthrobacter sp. Hiyo4]
MLFLNQLDDAAFRWLIPGQRAELVAALIKSLPKQVRKNFVPAPDVAGRPLPPWNQTLIRPR